MMLNLFLLKKNEENDLYKKLYEIARTKEYQI
jgi:hypothetical protein